MHRKWKDKCKKGLAAVLIGISLINHIEFTAGAAEASTDSTQKSEEISKESEYKETKIIEVSGFTDFMQAVSEVASEDDFSPAYEFQKDTATAVINGEEKEISAAVEKKGESYLVPEEVFSEDEGVNAADITDGSGVVSLEMIAEKSDYEAYEQENTAKLVNPFQNKRLIVKGGQGFDTCGAKSVIQGYGDLFILTYPSQEETKAAYEKLREVSGLTVEIDAVLEASDIQTKEGKSGEEEQISDMAAVSENQPEVLAAVIDSGFDFSDCPSDRVQNGTDISGDGTVQDYSGHGTSMANIIIEHTAQNVKILPVKVSDREGRTSSLKIYMGIRYAVEQGADIINISMAAYKPANAFIVSDAIRQAVKQGVYVVVSAGNYGEDTKNYVPANADEAIVVSAVNADGILDAYSNFGYTVDYCANGSVVVRGLGNKEEAVSGTSVSAAIVSAVIGGLLSCHPDMTYSDAFSLLNREAKDLGEKGKDAYYGNGFLSLETISAILEDKEGKERAEILTCDWKNISDDMLNDYIASAEDIDLRKFLDGLTKQETEELLSREVMFRNNHVVVQYDEEGNEAYRHENTLYDYLYSADYDEYRSQYYIYYANKTATVLLNTSLNGTCAKLNVYSPAIATNPVDDADYRKGVKVSGTSGGAVDTSNVKLNGFETLTDDSGNPNTIGQYCVSGLVIEKPQGYHLHMVKEGKKYAYGGNWWSKAYTPPPGLWTGGYVYVSNISGKSCKTKSVDAIVMVGVWDFVAKNDKNKSVNQKYTLNFQKGDIKKTYGNWEIKKNASCTAAGSKSRTVSNECSQCEAVFSGDAETQTIARLAHSYITKYGTSNNIVNGMRWQECQRNCSGYDKNNEYWQKNYAYLQQEYYRYMDVDGNYPGYTVSVNDYYAAGTTVPACKHTDDGTTEFLTSGIDAYVSPSYAMATYVDIPRKQYSVVFHGNGETGGKTEPHLNVYCGKTFVLNKNGFLRTGYDFMGWSKTADGNVKYGEQQSGKNFSLTHGATVHLYAKWEPHVFTIHLDNEGADKNENDVETVYEKYSVQYFSDLNCLKQFPNQKITVPQKHIPDSVLLGGKRRQQFLGYFTERSGMGEQMVKKNGSLIANINHAGNYKYFIEDATVYAYWTDMYAVQFSDNLTKADYDVVGIHENELPETKWKAKGGAITVQYEPASIENDSFRDIYRLKGWSLTPEISGDDEIILSEEKTKYTFHKDEDVTLYAQWDTSFRVTYVGNEQSEGMDYMDLANKVTDSYTFSPNEEDQVANLPNETADYFIKTIEKPTVDIKTGEAKDAHGKAYMETIPYSFQGWSMVRDKKRQNKQRIYQYEDEAYKNAGIIIEAKEIAKNGSGEGLTFHEPVEDYGSFNATHKETAEQSSRQKGAGLREDGMPFVNMYAIWDQYPQIIANDLYFPLSYAQEGVLTEEYLLNLATATDEELKGAGNADGKMKNGTDSINGTSFSVLDYQSDDFLGADGDVIMSITYRAEDSVGNVTTKMVTVHLVDTTAEEFDNGSVRFISKEHIDTLSENSIWKSEEYAAVLAKVLGNGKIGEEYTEVSAFQQAIGEESVKKPGSGTWNSVKQVWEFAHEQVREVQDYVENHGLFGSQKGFLSAFQSCRIK